MNKIQTEVAQALKVTTQQVEVVLKMLNQGSTVPFIARYRKDKTDNLNGISNNDSDQIVVGGEYNFKDNMIAHAYIGQNWADYTSPTDPTQSVADIEVFAVGAGLEYLF